MIPLISIFGWFDIVVISPFVLYFGYKGVKWIVLKFKSSTTEKTEE